MKRHYITISICLLLVFILYHTHNLFGAGNEFRDAFASVFKGDTKNYLFTIRNHYTYDVVNLTGFIVKFRVKKNPSDSSYEIDKTCTLLDAENGQATVALSTSDTDIDSGTYYAYIILTNDGETIYETLLKSTWKVTQ